MDFAQVPQDERPREKLIKYGPSSLSLAELLAILLRTGMKGEDVVALSQGLLNRMGGLEGLARVSVAELMQEKGLKQAKAASLAAALELGKRMVLLKTTKSSDWQSILLAKALDTKYMERECIFAIFLNLRGGVLGESVLSYGGITGAYLDMPVFFRQAVRFAASKVIIMHNHPDGCRTPSNEDIRLTEHIEQGLRFLGMQLKGHYIAADGALYTVKGEPLQVNSLEDAAYKYSEQQKRKIESGEQFCSVSDQTSSTRQ